MQQQIRQRLSQIVKRVVKTLFTLIAFSGCLTSNALAKSICYDRDDLNELSIKVTYPDALIGDFFPIQAVKTDATNNGLTTNAVEFSEALQSLPGPWQTPGESWPIWSVNVEYKVGRQTVCRVIYSQNRVFAQYDDLRGFVVQSVSPSRFRKITRTFYPTTIAYE